MSEITDLLYALSVNYDTVSSCLCMVFRFYYNLDLEVARNLLSRWCFRFVKQMSVGIKRLVGILIFSTHCLLTLTVNYDTVSSCLWIFT